MPGCSTACCSSFQVQIKHASLELCLDDADFGRCLFEPLVPDNMCHRQKARTTVLQVNRRVLKEFNCD